MSQNPIVDYRTTPAEYHHITLSFDGVVATLALIVFGLDGVVSRVEGVVMLLAFAAMNAIQAQPEAARFLADAIAAGIKPYL